MEGINPLEEPGWLDLDALIVFGTDPIHAARGVPIFYDLGCHHRSTALGAYMGMGFAFVAKTCARCFGNLLCHLNLFSFFISAYKKRRFYGSQAFQSIAIFIQS
jgi:hypothetical protein